MSHDPSETNNSEIQKNDQPFFKKTKNSLFDVPVIGMIDYKNPDFLIRFVSEGGRILPSRITNVPAKHQRAIKNAIKRSRNLALLPFIQTGK